MNQQTSSLPQIPPVPGNLVNLNDLPLQPPQNIQMSPPVNPLLTSIGKNPPQIAILNSDTDKPITMPVFDLTNKQNEPFVVCKIPLEVYNRVLTVIKSEKTQIANKEVIVKGSWSEDEDKLLKELVEKYGPKRWSFIASQGITGRTGKQCRERYLNHLDKQINKREWTQEEDQLIVQLQVQFGNKWSKIAKYKSDILKGRTPNMIKNRWNSTLKKKVNISIQNLTNVNNGNKS